jgi:hypothetical protein
LDAPFRFSVLWGDYAFLKSSMVSGNGKRFASCVGALTAAIGVCLGGALFLVATYSYHETGLGPMAAGVIIGALIGALSEWMAGIISTGHLKPIPPRPFLIFASLVLIFELFASSATELPKLLEARESGAAALVATVLGKNDSLKTSAVLDRLDRLHAGKQVGEDDAALKRVLKHIELLMPSSDQFAVFGAKWGLQRPKRLIGYHTPSGVRTPYYDVSNGFVYERSKGARCGYHGSVSLDHPAFFDVGEEAIVVPDWGREQFGNSRNDADEVCWRALVNMSSREREKVLDSSLLIVLSRYDFYDPLVFPSALDSDLARQRDLCDRLMQAESQAPGCISRRSDDLVPNWRIIRMNLHLLARTVPALIAHSEVYYADLLVFVLSWAVSAALLGYILISGILWHDLANASPLRRLTNSLVLALGSSLAAAIVFVFIVTLVRAFNVYLVPFLSDLLNGFDAWLWVVLLVVPLLVKAFSLVPDMQLEEGTQERWRLGRFVVPRNAWSTVLLNLLYCTVVTVGALSLVALFALISQLLLPLLFVSYIGSAVDIGGGLVSLCIFAAVVWIVPALPIVLIAPQLKPSSRLPVSWFFVAACVAGALFGDLILIREGERTLAVVLMLCPLALLSFSRARALISEVWPVLALSIALSVFGLSHFVSNVFGSMLEKLSIATTHRVAMPDFLEWFQIESPMADARGFQLALQFSIAFWLTVAVLFAWRIAEPGCIKGETDAPSTS